jgi:hypothetical protein
MKKTEKQEKESQEVSPYNLPCERVFLKVLDIFPSYMRALLRELENYGV